MENPKLPIPANEAVSGVLLHLQTFTLHSEVSGELLSSSTAHALKERATFTSANPATDGAFSSSSGKQYRPGSHSSVKAYYSETVSPG